ncbi:hypothetical protein MAUB_41510 [Mycolicibacterium aubagnense]|uniref:Lipoprotein n=1 Tax=Mycolicibacterium aubagnense TaxID=319707 RepID=A0ABN5YX48_9MYCO|nr:hypothetical protein [Mycolicibacterium aubagnense]WGI32184.1 hypothetical protein QDT91_23800 [Mycolicibacterium aubagnense]BBX86278.1 hypothetical protein MAUB_41510 [Mycolicibacterium aubagnense]
MKDQPGAHREHPRSVRVLSAVTILVTAAGCTPSGNNHTTDTSPHSHSADFPDLTTFTATDPAGYSTGTQAKPKYSFTTPSGQQCSMEPSSSSQNAAAYCGGSLPGRDGDWGMSVSNGTAAVGGPHTDKTSPEAPAKAPSPTLPTHHVVRFATDDLQCGIIDNGTAACRIGKHGFLVSTDKLTLF